MNPLDTITPDFVQGFLRILDFGPDGVREVCRVDNLYVHNGADIVASALANRSGYHISTMYMEFENLAAPNDPIIPPAFDRSANVAYYSNLSPPRDFLRIPLTLMPTLASTDDNKFENNQVTFFGISTGSVGENGLPFIHTQNSTIFGGALIASPVPDTQANDRLFSRTYWADGAVLKQQNHQIGVQWTLRFL